MNLIWLQSAYNLKQPNNNNVYKEFVRSGLGWLEILQINVNWPCIFYAQLRNAYVFGEKQLSKQFGSTNSSMIIISVFLQALEWIVIDFLIPQGPKHHAKPYEGVQNQGFAK